LVVLLFTTALALIGRVALNVALIRIASGVMMVEVVVYALTMLEPAQTILLQRTLVLATQTKIVLHAKKDTTVHGVMRHLYVTTKVTLMDVNSINLVILHALLTVPLLQRIALHATSCQVAFGALTLDRAQKRTLLRVHDSHNAKIVTDMFIVTLAWTSLAVSGAKRPLVY